MALSFREEQVLRVALHHVMDKLAADPRAGVIAGAGLATSRAESAYRGLSGGSGPFYSRPGSAEADSQVGRAPAPRKERARWTSYRTAAPGSYGGFGPFHRPGETKKVLDQTLAAD